VSLAEKTGLTVTQTLVLLRGGGGRRTNRGSDLPPPLEPLPLLGLQLGLSSNSAGLKDCLFSQVTDSSGPDGSLLLVNLREPSEQLVGLTLGHL